MKRDKLERSLTALSVTQGHPGTLDIRSVCDMIEMRDGLIEECQRIFIEDALERRKKSARKRSDKSSVS